MAETQEDLIAFADVSSLAWLPKRRREKLHSSTVYRWYANGIRGVKLEAISVGGTFCTTKSWLMDFFRRLASAPTPAETKPPTTKQQEQAQERARATVEKHLGRRGSKLVGAGA